MIQQNFACNTLPFLSSCRLKTISLHLKFRAVAQRTKHFKKLWIVNQAQFGSNAFCQRTRPQQTILGLVKLLIRNAGFLFNTLKIRDLIGLTGNFDS